MDISVIIVSWKVRDLLRQCLDSIFKNTSGVSFEVIVVDNDSGDGTAEMVARKYPQVGLVASNRNLGFAAGNNIGLEMAQGDIIYLLNPDTELVGNSLAELADFMERHPEAGIVGTKLINLDGSLQRSVRRFPGFVLGFLWTLKIHKLMPRLPIFSRYLALDFNYGLTQPCQQVMGASMAIRGQVIERVGRLDERYFIWFEEVDYCKMADDAGFEVWYTPEITVRHHGGISFGQVNGVTNQRRFNASLRQYALKHFGWWQWMALALSQPFSIALAWVTSFGNQSRPSKQ